MLDDTTFDHLLSRIVSTAKDLGQEGESHHNTTIKLIGKDAEITELKRRLCKYEQIPGYPLPIKVDFIDGDDHAKKIGEAFHQAAKGNRIEAIKIVRQITGAGLRESKDAVERGFPPPCVG